MNAPSQTTWLDHAWHLSLVTFRRDGTEVATPVWFARERDALHIFSAGDAGKVKRLRLSSRARIAHCDARGAIKGPWVDVEATVIDDPAGKQAALRALRKKYGVVMWMGDFFSILSGRLNRRAYIRIRGFDGH